MLYIVAGNEQEAADFARTVGVPEEFYHFISEPEQVAGYCGPIYTSPAVVFVGTWESAPHANSIMNVVEGMREILIAEERLKNPGHMWSLEQVERGDDLKEAQ